MRVGMRGMEHGAPRLCLKGTVILSSSQALSGWDAGHALIF